MYICHIAHVEPLTTHQLRTGGAWRYNRVVHVLVRFRKRWIAVVECVHVERSLMARGVKELICSVVTSVYFEIFTREVCFWLV